MNTLDLFTGIGGFHRALAPVSKPILYCDIDPKSQAVLNDHMRRGVMPRAPIVPDVQDLDAIKRAVAGKRVDFIVSSSPCTGFSTFGKQEGLGNQASGLFGATIDVIRHFKPKLVLFENVANILRTNQGEDLVEITKGMRALGYTLRWTVVSGCDVGAPQVRKRWFCLCVLRGVPASKFPDLPKIMARNSAHWSGSPPNLTAAESNTGAEMFQLGNSIIPQAARRAFVRLYTGFRDNALSFSLECEPLAKGRRRDNRHKGFPSHACVDLDGNLMLCNAPKVICPNEKIVLDPRQFPYTTDRKYYGTHARLEPLRAPVTIASWPTPRAGGSHHSFVLSPRTIKDLGTCVAFCSHWGERRIATPPRNHRTSLHFVCWLMGFPKNYLDSARSSRIRTAAAEKAEKAKRARETARR